MVKKRNKNIKQKATPKQKINGPTTPVMVQTSYDESSPSSTKLVSVGELPDVFRSAQSIGGRRNGASQPLDRHERTTRTPQHSLWKATTSVIVWPHRSCPHDDGSNWATATSRRNLRMKASVPTKTTTASRRIVVTRLPGRRKRRWPPCLSHNCFRLLFFSITLR